MKQLMNVIAVIMVVTVTFASPPSLGYTVMHSLTCIGSGETRYRDIMVMGCSWPFIGTYYDMNSQLVMIWGTLNTEMRVSPKGASRIKAYLESWETQLCDDISSCLTTTSQVTGRLSEESLEELNRLIKTTAEHTIETASSPEQCNSAVIEAGENVNRSPELTGNLKPGKGVLRLHGSLDLAPHGSCNIVIIGAPEPVHHL